MKLLEFIAYMEEIVVHLAEVCGGRDWCWALEGLMLKNDEVMVTVMVSGQVYAPGHPQASPPVPGRPDSDGWVKVSCRQIVNLVQARHLRDEDAHLPWTVLGSEMTNALQRRVREIETVERNPATS